MPEPTRSVARAFGWMCGTIAAFTVMAIAGRELSAEIGPAQVIAFRNIGSLAILAVLLAWHGWAHARTARPGRHLLRNAAHFAAQCGWFYAIARIPIAEVFAIEFTVPIWTALLASVFLGEQLTRWRAAAIALGFAGVLVILRPGAAAFEPAAVAALGAAIGYAVTFVVTKDLVATDRPLTILLWMNLVQLPLSLGISAPGWVMPSPALWPWVVVVGICGLTSHYCVSRALACGDASVVVPIDFLRLPVAGVVAYLLYAEAVEPEVVLGGLVVVAGVWLNLRKA